MTCTDIPLVPLVWCDHVMSHGAMPHVDEGIMYSCCTTGHSFGGHVFTMLYVVPQVTHVRHVMYF